jgi:PleD family two-component response regulator
MHVVLPLASDSMRQALEQVIEGGSRAGSSLSALEAELDLEQSEAAQASGELRMAEMERHVDRLEKTQASEAREATAPATAKDTAEVLVVEDNPDMRRLLAHLVGQEFRVRTARNGREGLELLRERAPDVVLTDVMMPEMSGVELCAAIKGDPATAASRSCSSPRRLSAR